MANPDQDVFRLTDEPELPFAPEQDDFLPPAEVYDRLDDEIGLYAPGRNEDGLSGSD